MAIPPWAAKLQADFATLSSEVQQLGMLRHDIEVVSLGMLEILRQIGGSGSGGSSSNTPNANDPQEHNPTALVRVRYSCIQDLFSHDTRVMHHIVSHQPVTHKSAYRVGEGPKELLRMVKLFYGSSIHQMSSYYVASFPYGKRSRRKR
jgi:hypothetical protein